MQEQLDELQAWYDGFSPFPMLHELAEAELKQAVESTNSFNNDKLSPRY